LEKSATQIFYYYSSLLIGEANMNLPSGIQEAEFLQVMGVITSTVKESYSFGYYGADDISQECYVFALEALPKYNLDRGSLFTFLNTHIKNRLLNLRRNKLIRPQLPCLDCQVCFSEEERLRCPKYIKWKKRNDIKRSLMESSELNDFDVGGNNPDISSFLLNTELMCLIDKHLPINLRTDYRRFLEGSKLSKKKRTRLLDTISGILEDNQYGGE